MDSISSILSAILRGFFDSLKGTFVVFYLDKEMNKRTSVNKEQITQTQKTGIKKDNYKRQEESKVLKRVLQCCLLNAGVFLASIMVFEYILLPTLRILLSFLIGSDSGISHTIWSFLQPIISIIFGMIWVLPLFILSKIVNSLWFQDIANSAYKFRKGRPQTMQSISKLIADILFSLLVQALFLVQSMLVNLLPIQYLGTILCFVHMCLLYSLYAFEYKWFNMGWELHKRLTYIENNWPYFLGFGLPLTILTHLPSSYIKSGCIFSSLFPFFILSGNEATPFESSSYDCPLKLFSPVVAISNSFFNKTLQRKGSLQQTQQQVKVPSSISPSSSNISLQRPTKR